VEPVERYPIDASVQHGYVGARQARTFLPFLLPHLRPGLEILEVGCGVGALLLDVAATTGAARVVGVDPDDGQLAVGRANAQMGGLPAEFVEGSAYSLPFPDESFDVVYANAVLLYLRRPVDALREMRRVLRADGVVAVSDDDISTLVFSPDVPGLGLGPPLFERVVAHEGGNTRYSRHLRTLFREAGFARTEGHALTPETYGDAAGARWMADVAIGMFSAPAMATTILDEGWASQAELDDVLRAMDEWGNHPDAFMTWLYCAALGWKA
jgi:SAM-dependent methyltransferase